MITEDLNLDNYKPPKARGWDRKTAARHFARKKRQGDVFSYFGSEVDLYVLQLDALDEAFPCFINNDDLLTLCDLSQDISSVACNESEYEKYKKYQAESLDEYGDDESMNYLRRINKNKSEIPRVFTRRWSRTRRRYEIYSLNEKYKVYATSKSSFKADNLVSELNREERDHSNMFIDEHVLLRKPHEV